MQGCERNRRATVQEWEKHVKGYMRFTRNGTAFKRCSGNIFENTVKMLFLVDWIIAQKIVIGIEKKYYLLNLKERHLSTEKNYNFREKS